LVVRVIDNGRTDISSVLKVSRPITAERVESGTSTSGEGPKAGDDVFVAMNLHVLHMAACVFTT